MRLLRVFAIFLCVSFFAPNGFLFCPSSRRFLACIQRVAGPSKGVFPRGASGDRHNRAIVARPISGRFDFYPDDPRVQELISNFPPQTIALYSQHEIKPALINLINSAQLSICASIYSISQPCIVQALIRAALRGVRVIIVVDRQCLNQPWSVISDLLEAGVEVYKPSRTMHLKCAMFDFKHLWTGSFNWTERACSYNYEQATCVSGNSACILKYCGDFSRLLSCCRVLELFQ